MTHEKLSLRETLEQNKLLTFILFLAEIPCFLLSAQISSAFYSVIPRIDDDFIFMVCLAFVNYTLHFILYIFVRFALKKDRSYIFMIIAQLAVIVIWIPFVVQDYLHSTIILDDFAIWIGSCILSQTLLFGVFSGAVSLLDIRSRLRNWQKISISFVLAIPVGVLASRGAWAVLRFIYEHV